MAQRAPFYFVNEVLSVYRVDTNDSNRLTNKYFSWKETVKQIHIKHQSLYDNLTLIEHLKVRSLIWSDARARCKSSGLIFRYIGYSILLFPIRCVSKIIHIIK